MDYDFLLLSRKKHNQGEQESKLMDNPIWKIFTIFKFMKLHAPFQAIDKIVSAASQ